jgi:NADPH:quinone reductase
VLAAVISEPGGVDQFELRDVPEPAPAPGELRIAVAYAGLNWGDIQKRQGVYPDPIAYPAVIGVEVSGIVDALGPGTRGFRLGERVAAITGPRMLGGYAEKCVLPSSYAFKLPESIPFELAAVFPVAATTAYHLVNTALQLRKGEVLLVHAIGGAVGLMVTQFAVAKGASVIGTVGSSGKAALPLAYGAVQVIDRSREDFVEAANSFTRDKGVDYVIDSLGGDVLERSFDALRPFGRVVNIGEAAGYPDFDIRAKLYRRSTSLAGFEFLHAGPGSRRWKKAAREIIRGFAEGRFRLPLERVYPLAEVRSAHERLESRGVSGKLALRIGGQ